MKGMKGTNWVKYANGMKRGKLCRNGGCKQRLCRYVLLSTFSLSLFHYTNYLQVLTFLTLRLKAATSSTPVAGIDTLMTVIIFIIQYHSRK